jgi:hypothetical protein
VPTDHERDGIGPLHVYFRFYRLRFPKADAFSSSVICDEFNPSAFKRAADGGFIRMGNRNLPLNDLGPACRGGRRVRDVQQRVKHSAIPGWRRPCMGSSDP